MNAEDITFLIDVVAVLVKIASISLLLSAALLVALVLTCLALLWSLHGTIRVKKAKRGMSAHFEDRDRLQDDYP